MEVVINETEKFRKDLESFSPKDQKIIISKFNYLLDAFQKNPELFRRNIHKLNFQITLQDGNTPSLFILRIGFDIRMIVSFESDPLFDQLNVFLYRCIRHKDIAKTYRGIAEALYQNNVILEEE